MCVCVVRAFKNYCCSKESTVRGLPWWLSYKESTCNAGDTGLIPGSGRSPGEGHGNPLQYSCLENPMDRGAWQATVHRVAQSQIQLKRLNTHTQSPSIILYLRPKISIYRLFPFSNFVTMLPNKEQKIILWRLHYCSQKLQLSTV